MPSRQTTVQYRRLNRENLPNPDTLKDIIVASMQKQRGRRLVGEYVGHRRFDLDQDGRLTLLNHITEKAHWDDPFFAGQLAYFERGANVPARVQFPPATPSFDRIDQLSWRPVTGVNPATSDASRSAA